MVRAFRSLASTLLLIQLIRAALSSGLSPKMEPGFTVETVFDLRQRSANAYSLHPDPRGKFVLALDSASSRMFRISLPLSENSSFELFAGSTKGAAGYVDGAVTEALFDHPQSLAIGTNGDVYVADTRNYVVRKISKGQVTTIAGGGPPKPGYADGPGDTARFSNEFSLTYWCGSLLISDRGNRAVREMKVDASESCSSTKPSISEIKSWWLAAPAVVGVFLVLGVFIYRRSRQLKTSSLWYRLTTSCIVVPQGWMILSIGSINEIARATSSVLLLIVKAATGGNLIDMKLHQGRHPFTPAVDERSLIFQQLEQLFEDQNHSQKQGELPDLIDLTG